MNPGEVLAQILARVHHRLKVTMTVQAYEATVTFSLKTDMIRFEHSRSWNYINHHSLTPSQFAEEIIKEAEEKIYGHMEQQLCMRKK